MEVTIRKGSWADTEAFICLLQNIRENMDHKEWFYLDEPDEFRSMMASGVMELWTAMDGERMVAALSVLRPGLDSYNYGYALDFTKEELLRVIHMDSAAVHPEYRGRGLQRKLIQAAEAEINADGEYILLCTVHPDNRFSLQNVLKQGYTIQKKLPMYGGIRFILRKN